MNPKLQAGIELTIEKAAAREQGVGLLAGTLNRKMREMQKRAEDQGVQVTGGGGGSPSSNSSDGMEDKNKGFGKGVEKLDDDPTKAGAKETGQVMSAQAGKNITTETSGMPDLSLPKCANSARVKVMTTMLRSLRTA